jgi:DNA-binding beta-propeller fold protein YncE
MALSSDGKLLFAVNTPDNRLEVFKVTKHGLKPVASVTVGLEPVAVAVRNDHEVWVVNHLSDSVSIVDVSDEGNRTFVRRTVLVGDEPRDIVFAGEHRGRAFITTAHRGQNTRRDPQLTTPGVGRADVWVFDAANLGNTLEGEPLTVLTLFTDTPRALAVTPDGRSVYAAGFHTGNRTTMLLEDYVPDGFGPNGVLGPRTNFQGVNAPEVGLIVKYDGQHWVDIAGRQWDPFVKFNLPDKDVFMIDAMATPPQEVSSYQGVGTILYNMVVNPVSGNVYVSNTEANNVERFDGPGTFAGASLKGRLHLNRISVLSPGGNVAARHLNKHIDYTHCCDPVPNVESERSLSIPNEMAITRDGKTLYVAALGSAKVGVYKTAELENDTFVPSTANQIEIPSGGPSGLLLDERNERLYVFSRFENAISVISTKTRTEVSRAKLWSPEPEKFARGRRFLYDARTTSSHGDQACASCHVFGDFDSLAWDLGNPDEVVSHNPGPFRGPLSPTGVPLDGAGQPFNPDFHPMKGPLTTQSLRGMANNGPMHWRGDRTAGNDEPNVPPNSGVFNERGAFKQFQKAFTGLMRRDSPIPDADMEAFTDFMLEVMYPPNPIRNLDNSLTPDQEAGRVFFTTRRAANVGPCTGCHTLDPEQGFFGADGFSAFQRKPMMFKVAHLRNAYQKLGMFGFSPLARIVAGSGLSGFQGDQVRGYGFTREGGFDTVARSIGTVGFTTQFNAGGFTLDAAGDAERRQVEAFVHAFPSNLAPIVGQQVTLTAANAGLVAARVALLEERADAGDCDLVVKTQRGEHERGFLYSGGVYVTDHAGAEAFTSARLRELATKHHRFVTFTCAPPGSGVRMGIDHDEDGVLDGDED